jgi:hypothetical protein
MTLGAMIVLAVLVVAGIYVPRISKTNAKAPDTSGMAAPDNTSQTSVQPTQPTAPAAGVTNPSSAAQPGAPVATTASVDTSSPMPTPPAPAVATPAPKDVPSPKASHPAKKLAAQNNGMASNSSMAQPSDNGMAAPAASDSPNFDELETEVDQMSNRAAAINSSLDRLQQQQSAAGFGLRGDMVAKQASMKGNLNKAEEAIQQRDAVRTKKYLDLTEHDVDALERFLGH